MRWDCGRGWQQGYGSCARRPRGIGTWDKLLAMQSLQRRQIQSMPRDEVLCNPTSPRFSCQSGGTSSRLVF
uniref:L-idonate 5-dehydrogenase n=1 Tax=Rhizophora mucronata TaxID=61149 RepID=A0A2P2LWW8_RHIMU